MRKLLEKAGNLVSSTSFPHSLHQSMYAERTRASRAISVSSSPPSSAMPSIASKAISNSSTLSKPSCWASFSSSSASASAASARALDASDCAWTDSMALLKTSPVVVGSGASVSAGFGGAPPDCIASYSSAVKSPNSFKLINRGTSSPASRAFFFATTLATEIAL